jgi:hypothetical protein
MDGVNLQTRRAVLAAAAGSAAALAANAALAVPVARAVDEPLLLNVANAGSATTSLEATLAGETAFATANTDATGTSVTGVVGDGTGAPTETGMTGVFGWAPASDSPSYIGSGVWGASGDVGVWGSGGTGVLGDGGAAGWGVYGWSEESNAVYGQSLSGIALRGLSTTGYGLYVTGKVKFSNRSGRSSVSKGKTSYTKTGLTGVTSSSIVIAVLQQVESGTWIRAAVAGTAKFTVYFNRALPSSSVVGWLVLN